MQDYLININDLIVTDQSFQYNFLSEMYPVIDELYCKLWFYENLSIMDKTVKEKRITDLKEYISKLLEDYKIPEYMLFSKIKDNRYIEPISNEEFRISNKVNSIMVSEEEKERFLNKNKNNISYKESINKFKELTKTKYRKR